MTSYRWVWTATVVSMTCIACLRGQIAWSDTLLGVVVAALVVGAATAGVLLGGDGRRPNSPGVVQTTARNALVGASLVLVASVIVQAGGAIGWLVVLLFATGAPPIVERVAALLHRAGVRRTRAAAPAPAEPVEPIAVDVTPRPEAPVEKLSTPNLVLAWRYSYRALERATTHQARARIAALRQAYLDELERRDPAGVQRWLASGARAASDPTRFLTIDTIDNGGEPHQQAS
jgi:hypothetical protein